MRLVRYTWRVLLHWSLSVILGMGAFWLAAILASAGDIDARHPRNLWGIYHIYFPLLAAWLFAHSAAPEREPRAWSLVITMTPRRWPIWLAKLSYACSWWASALIIAYWASSRWYVAIPWSSVLAASLPGSVALAGVSASTAALLSRPVTAAAPAITWWAASLMYGYGGIKPFSLLSPCMSGPTIPWTGEKTALIVIGLALMFGSGLVMEQLGSTIPLTD